MTIDGAILGRLKAVTAITNIVGTGTSARIYAEKLPQDPTLEAITFKHVSGDRIHAFGQDSGLVMARYQLDAWGNTWAESRDLADAIRGNGAGNAFSRFRGTQDTTVVDDVLLDNELATFEDESEGYRTVQDYLIWYQE